MAVRWPSSKAEDELRGSHAGGVVEFKLTDDAAFDLGRVAVRALAFRRNPPWLEMLAADGVRPMAGRTTAISGMSWNLPSCV